MPMISDERIKKRSASTGSGSSGVSESRLGSWMKRVKNLFRTIACVTFLGAVTAPAMAETGAYIVFDAASGEIFARHNADQAWYPASITKLMTAYVTFQMIKSGRLTLNSPVVMSARAASQPPSKMGFPVGTVVTIDNALKMIMVKSANDMAWALGESVGGSKDAFVALMNDYARRIGMTGTVWDNPNGLPDPNQMTTAHDMGLLARALLREFPEYDFYYRLPGIQLGNRIIRNHNHLMDHYPGTDGMKTGYICASGYNVVASATRNGHRMIAVILGSHGARPRAELAADLFNHAFERVTSPPLFAFGATPENLDHYQFGPEAGQPVRDIHAEICGGKRDTGSDESLDETAETAASGANSNHPGNLVPPGAQHVARAELLSPHFDIGQPVKVWLGGADSLSAGGAATVGMPVQAPQQQPVQTAPIVLAPKRTTAVPAAPRVRAPGAIMPLPAATVGPAAQPAPVPAPGDQIVDQSPPVAKPETPPNRPANLVPQPEGTTDTAAPAEPRASSNVRAATLPQPPATRKTAGLPTPPARPQSTGASEAKSPAKPAKPRKKPVKPDPETSPSQ